MKDNLIKGGFGVFFAFLAIWIGARVSFSVEVGRSSDDDFIIIYRTGEFDILNSNTIDTLERGGLVTVQNESDFNFPTGKLEFAEVTTTLTNPAFNTLFPVSVVESRDLFMEQAGLFFASVFILNETNTVATNNTITSIMEAEGFVNLESRPTITFSNQNSGMTFEYALSANYLEAIRPTGGTVIRHFTIVYNPFDIEINNNTGRNIIVREILTTQTNFISLRYTTFNNINSSEQIANIHNSITTFISDKGININTPLVMEVGFNNQVRFRVSGANKYNQYTQILIDLNIIDAPDLEQEAEHENEVARRNWFQRALDVLLPWRW